MKLNNRGWSLNLMLFLCAVLLLFLLLAFFYSAELYENMGESIKSNVSDELTYSDIEEAVNAAAKTYIKQYYGEAIGEGTITISTSNLINYGFLDKEMLKIKTDLCYGYSLVSKDENELESDAYINCNNYKTDGYQEWRFVDNE